MPLDETVPAFEEHGKEESEGSELRSSSRARRRIYVHAARLAALALTLALALALARTLRCRCARPAAAAAAALPAPSPAALPRLARSLSRSGPSFCALACPFSALSCCCLGRCAARRCICCGLRRRRRRRRRGPLEGALGVAREGCRGLVPARKQVTRVSYCERVEGRKRGEGRDAREGRGEVERGGRDDDEHEGRVLAAGSVGRGRDGSVRCSSSERAGAGRTCGLSLRGPRASRGRRGPGASARARRRSGRCLVVARAKRCRVARTSRRGCTSARARARCAGRAGGARRVWGGLRLPGRWGLWSRVVGGCGGPRAGRRACRGARGQRRPASGATSATRPALGGRRRGARASARVGLAVVLAVLVQPCSSCCWRARGSGCDETRSSRAPTVSLSLSLPPHPRALHLHLRELTQCAMPDSGHPANSPTHPSSPPAPLAPAASVPPRHPLLAPPGHPGTRAPPPSTPDADPAPPAKRRRTLDPPPPSPAPAPAPPPRRPHSPFALSLAGPFAAHSLALASDFAPAVDAASALGALPAAAEQPHSVEPAPPLLPALGGALVASGVDSLSVLAHEEDRGINALGPDDDELTRENERAALEELEHVKNGASSSLSLSLGPPECKS